MGPRARGRSILTGDADGCGHTYRTHQRGSTHPCGGGGQGSASGLSGAVAAAQEQAARKAVEAAREAAQREARRPACAGCGTRVEVEPIVGDHPESGQIRRSRGETYTPGRWNPPSGSGAHSARRAPPTPVARTGGPHPIHDIGWERERVALRRRSGRHPIHRPRQAVPLVHPLPPASPPKAGRAGEERSPSQAVGPATRLRPLPPAARCRRRGGCQRGTGGPGQPPACTRSATPPRCTRTAPRHPSSTTA